MARLATPLSLFLVAASSFALTTTPASAAAGCAVDNTSTNIEGDISLTYPPGSASAHLSSVDCSYVTETGKVRWQCQITAGNCLITRSGTNDFWGCTGTGLACSNVINVPAGTKLTLRVSGGKGSIMDFQLV